MNNKIIKTKARCPKTFSRAFSVREIAEKIRGSLKVADSFLYLYRRFGAPCADTNDEYKISYEYNFWYKGLYFVLCGTTPEFVYLDCYMPKKHFLLQRDRYRKDVRRIFDRAAADGILTYPWASYDDVTDSLTKRQREQAQRMFNEELASILGEENDRFIASVKEDSPEEDKKKVWTLHEQVWKALAEKFWKWAGDDKEIKATFGRPDLRYLPEVEKTVKGFCKEMLKTEPIRGDINIQGWK